MELEAASVRRNRNILKKYFAPWLWPCVIPSVPVELLSLEVFLSDCLCPIRHDSSTNSFFFSEKFLEQCHVKVLKSNTARLKTEPLKKLMLVKQFDTNITQNYLKSELTTMKICLHHAKAVVLAVHG